jgi:hypothetical protein
MGNDKPITRCLWCCNWSRPVQTEAVQVAMRKGCRRLGEMEREGRVCAGRGEEEKDRGCRNCHTPILRLSPFLHSCLALLGHTDFTTVVVLAGSERSGPGGLAASVGGTDNCKTRHEENGLMCLYSLFSSCPGSRMPVTTRRHPSRSSRTDALMH